MLRSFMRSKIHRATVTHAELHYVGSLTVSSDLMAAAGLLPGEQVDVVDINNGARLTTYLIEGPRGLGVIGINGAAARLVSPGDTVIIIAYGLLADAEVGDFTPRVVFGNERNEIIQLSSDPSDAPHGSGLHRGDTADTLLRAPAPVGQHQ